ncbi:MAG: hypothetical protein ACK5MA_11445 [Parachlamydiaceae bacterium]
MRTLLLIFSILLFSNIQGVELETITQLSNDVKAKVYLMPEQIRFEEGKILIQINDKEEEACQLNSDEYGIFVYYVTLPPLMNHSKLEVLV